MVVEYTLRLYTGDLNANDVITIVEKVREGWRAKLNNKIDVILVSERPTPTILTAPPSPSLNQNKHFEGWVLMDTSQIGSHSHTRWTKSWMVLNTVPARFGIFESEIQKADKMRTQGDAALEDLISLTELETLRRDKTPAEMHPVKFKVKTGTRTCTVIVSAKDSMTDKTREVCKLLQESGQKEPAPPSSPEASRRNAASASINMPAKEGIHIPPSFDLSFKTSHASSSAPSLGGITKVQGIMGKPFKSFFKAETKADKQDPSRHTYAQATVSRSTGAGKSVSINEPDRKLQLGSSSGSEPFVVTKIYWQDGTYKTVAVKPKMSCEELCDRMTNKTKMATFSNLFRLFLRTHTSADRLLQADSNIFEMIMSWGQNTLNYQIVCDLDVSAKNTVKMHLEKRANPTIPTMSPTKQSPAKTSALSSNRSSVDGFGSEGSDPVTPDNFLARKFAEFEANGFPEDEEEAYEEEDIMMDDTPEDSSIAMMIEEMMKLKAELQEEQNQIAQLHMEDQNLNFLIGRLAQMQ